VLSTKISIITVVYNAVATIEQTILSVVKQDYSNIEYIIVDGGSTDGTLDIIKKYEDKIEHWVSEPDYGIYDAMNKGLTYATGDYIYYLGADDCLLAPNSISQVVSFLQDNPEVDVLCASVMMVDSVYRIEKVYSSNFSEADVLSGYNTPHQGMFVRREILQKYRFDTSYHIAADYKNFLKFYLDQNIALKKTAMIVAYYANDGVSGNGTDAQRMEDVRALQENGLESNACMQRQRGLLARIKNVIKRELKRTGLLKTILLRCGWKRHYCSWEFCRWCK